MSAPIVTWTWNGEVLVPLPRFHNLVNEQFVVGQMYRCEVIEEASLRSRRHYFACLHDAWLNLPDDLAMQFASDEHLRKHALCMTGYRNERKFVAATPQEARRIATFIKPRGEYAIISVAENVVVEWTAKSQSVKEMGAPTFQKSKTDVLDFVAHMIGLSAEELSAQSRNEDLRGHNNGPPLDDPAPPSPSDATAGASDSPAVSDVVTEPMADAETVGVPIPDSARPSRDAAVVEAAAGDDHAASDSRPRAAVVPAAVPPLSARDKATLRRYAGHLAETRYERDLRKGSGAFLSDHNIVEDTPLYEAARMIFAAHLARIQGTGTLQECDQVERAVAA
jgi:hypothetical protein